MTKKEINIKSRIRKIHFIYKYELLNTRLDLKDAFENYNFSEDDLKNLENIEKSYGELRTMIVKNLKDTWS
jgi:inner membrane protein involved in colicin E2 resistance